MLVIYISVQCPMGTYYDGLFKTCSKCPKGSYQPFIEQGECILCPSMTTTSGIGATEFLECEGNANSLLIYLCLDYLR